MRTSTNFFIFTLASADIMTLLSGNDRSLSCAGAGLSFPNQGATFDLSVYWHQYPFPFGESVCRIRAFLSEMWVPMCHLSRFSEQNEKKSLLSPPVVNYGEENQISGLSTAQCWPYWHSPVRDTWPFVILSTLTPSPGSGEPPRSSSFSSSSVLFVLLLLPSLPN